MKITDVKAYVVKPRYPDNAGTFEGDWTFVRAGGPNEGTVYFSVLAGFGGGDGLSLGRDRFSLTGCARLE